MCELCLHVSITELAADEINNFNEQGVLGSVHTVQELDNQLAVATEVSIACLCS